MAPQTAQTPADSAAAPRRRRRGVGGMVVQGLGELLITAGLVVLLYLVWQLWWTNIAADQEQSQAVTQMTRQFDGGSEPDPGYDPSRAGDPEVMEEPGNGQGIGVVYIPRLGEHYSRPLMQGVGSDVLDTLGLGHYPGTAMPGEVGNVALAGHRQTNGAVLDMIHTLQVGDRIHVRTEDGYYTYAVSSTEIVMPWENDVIAPVPGHPGEEPTERYLTLTTCHPRFGDTERYIVHARMESWRPASAGPPQEIAATVRQDARG